MNRRRFLLLAPAAIVASRLSRAYTLEKIPGGVKVTFADGCYISGANPEALLWMFHPPKELNCDLPHCHEAHYEAIKAELSELRA